MANTAFADTTLANTRKDGYWTSGVMIEKSNPQPLLFRSIVASNKDSTSLAFDIDPSCSKVSLSLIAYVQKGADASGLLNNGSFQARVDNKGIYGGRWLSSSNEMGDKLIFITLYPNNQADLIRDTRSGTTLRLKLTITGDSDGAVYLKFPLAGSNAAMLRSAELCLALQTRSPSPGSRNPRRSTPKSDADYF
ncbi:MAG TPA: hypothetical protein VF285_05230 [Castellaniella sp.]|uniref:hypothetical protein n=1 Tax=Castellaniella sp. TaxID=1955812 RepID=UPI002EE44662